MIAKAKETPCVKVSDSGEIEQAGDLAGILTNLEDNDVLVVDNIDSLHKSIVEDLEPAIVDFKLDIIVDRDSNARSVRLNLPQFALVATAEKKDQLSPIFLACFHIVEILDPYSLNELTEIVREFANEFGVGIDEAAADMIARSANGTPKEVYSRMRLVRVFSHTKAGSKTITLDMTKEALSTLIPIDQARTKEGREGIPSQVRMEVWRRDGGKCTKCGSREYLEYDHIIPVAKGGSNTARNIELLCEVCNRAKGALIQ